MLKRNSAQDPPGRHSTTDARCWRGSPKMPRAWHSSYVSSVQMNIIPPVYDGDGAGDEPLGRTDDRDDLAGAGCFGLLRSRTDEGRAMGTSPSLSTSSLDDEDDDGVDADDGEDGAAAAGAAAAAAGRVSGGVSTAGRVCARRPRFLLDFAFFRRSFRSSCSTSRSSSSSCSRAIRCARLSSFFTRYWAAMRRANSHSTMFSRS